LVVVLVLPATFNAEETRGGIAGRVTDASKATLARATLTVAGLVRGTAPKAATNPQVFQLSCLRPGTYEIVIEFPGLERHIEEKVSLQVSETLDSATVFEAGVSQPKRACCACD
jgi:hypothetical protein